MDRGLHYGDGLFETIMIEQGKPVFWRQHLQRLATGCKRLSLSMPDEALLLQEAMQLALGNEKAILKIIVTRGCGGRGYRQPENPQSTRVLSIHSFPENLVDSATKGVVVRFCDYRLAIQPGLAGLKHLNRLEQVMARSEWQDDLISEGLLLDSNEHVIEGTMSNVFLVRDGRIITPKLETNGVAGIIRALIIKHAGLLNLQVEESYVSREDIMQADEVFLTNCVIGIWPVIRIADRNFMYGPICQQLKDWLQAYKCRDLGYVA